MADVRGATVNPDFPNATFVHLASVEAGHTFFDERAPGAAVVSDQEKRLYGLMGLGRGSFRQLLGWRAIRTGFQALLRGHFVGKAVGDPRVMPGAFLVRGEELLWEHRAEHAGHQPDLGHVAEFAATVKRATSP